MANPNIKGSAVQTRKKSSRQGLAYFRKYLPNPGFTKEQSKVSDSFDRHTKEDKKARGEREKKVKLRE